MTDDRQFGEDMRFVLRNAQSKRILWWILQHCGIYSTSHNGATVSELQEGMRNIGLKIINGMGEVDPLAYPHLLLEQAEAALMKTEPNQEQPDENY